MDDASVRAQQLVDALSRGAADLDPDEVVREIEGLRARASGPTAEHLAWLAVAALHISSQRSMDLRGIDDVGTRIEALRAEFPAGSVQDLVAQALVASQRAVACNARSDVDGVRTQIERIRTLRRRLPADHPIAAQVVPGIDEMLRSFRAVEETLESHEGRGEVSADSLRFLRDALRQPGISRADRAQFHAQLGQAQVAMGGAHVEPGLDDLRAAAGVAERYDPRRVEYLTMLGGALVERAESDRAPRDIRPARHRAALEEAVRALDRARELAVDPAHPGWALLCQILGHAHRLLGHYDQAREIGRDGLRGHAWAVRLQSGTAAAGTAARDAAEGAILEARWCVGVLDVHGGLDALDAGRGLTLEAASGTGTVVDQLVRRDAADLARRWTEAVATRSVDDVPVALRREVVRALGSESSMRTPPAAEIRSALGRLGADALIYLVPGEQAQALGFALVVPARGEPSWRLLPDLFVAADGYPARYFAAASGADARDLGVAEPAPGEEDLPTALVGTSEWAWRAAIGPLLDQHLPQQHGLRSDRVHHLVLVPMGELSKIPWHAARGPAGFAVERAAFSTAVSGRLLCGSAAAEPVPLGRSGLVIGDPDTAGAASPLSGAQREAGAVRESFYPRARYLGRPSPLGPTPSGPGTPAELEAWLADDGAMAGTVLHAACHGVVRVATDESDTSYLVLAGGERLSAERLVQILSVARPRGLALAVLAACHLGVPGRGGYDEAFSLATALLASGTRSVISALWALPDTSTSVLMYFFHHFLNREGLRPAHALRAAQLCLIDPAENRWPQLPNRLRTLRGARAGELSDWAGFVHAGR